MASNELGYSFAPTFAGAEQGRQQSAAAAPQGAVKTLNFRLPQVTGSATSRALSPLVSDEMRGSNFGGAVLQSVLRTILGSDALSAYGSPAQEPSASPVLQTRDYGSSFLQSVRQAPPPQTGPSDNINTPQFEGHGDALPAESQNASAPTYGGGYNDPYWDSIPEEYRNLGPSYGMPPMGIVPWVPTRPPSPGFIVDSNPTGGGSRA